MRIRHALAIRAVEPALVPIEEAGERRITVIALPTGLVPRRKLTTLLPREQHGNGDGAPHARTEAPGEQASVDEEEDWERIPRTKRMALISQSTQPPWKFEKLAAFMVGRCHELKIVNTVCPVTIRRQKDTIEIAAHT